jgi:hypothetical protein
MRNPARVLVGAVASVLLAACASTHDLDKEGISVFGGGFSKEEIQPGFFKLYARSNSALFTTAGAARGTWDYVAAQLCGMNAYRELSVTENILRGPEYTFYLRGQGILAANQHNSTREGYLICNSSGLSDEQAKNILIEKNRAESVETRRVAARLAHYNPEDCTNEAQQQKSADHYFEIGQEYWKATRYDVAMSCFLKAQSTAAPFEHAYQEACFHIGMMYELGQGVERNPAVAEKWYRKSGHLKD